MRYILKNYQETAVAKLAAELANAGDRYRRTREVGYPNRSAVSLAAVTGAGKTVMAAATIETVLKGTATIPADPTAVFLWVSDSPDLNKQSMHRIEAALGPGSSIPTVTVESDFRERKLSPGSLYFINIQKLTRTSTIARRHYLHDEQTELGIEGLQQTIQLPVPDAGDYDFFQTLKRTLEDENITLYLIIDEAHRGMKRRTKRSEADRSTIIQRVIQGSGDVPPVPVVWGISATPERFKDFVSAASGLKFEKEITVDPGQVQDSGLLKDTIILYIPDEEGDFDHELLAQGTRRLNEMNGAWTQYARQENLPEPVVPLMVVQVPDKASDELIDEYVTTIQSIDPSLGISAFAHVFGDDKPILAAGTVIDKVPAERVQEMRSIRVLFAKEAISTGWDCPRAEVLVSFRAARDHTHVTQLMGRMVRTPLARRVEANDVLSSVTCILPKFDRNVAKMVAERISRGGTDDTDSGGKELRRVVIDPELVLPINGEEGGIEDQLWECFEALPNETVPSGTADPIKQLADLAAELSRDLIYPNAIRKTNESMFRSMDAAAIEYSDEFEAAIEDVENVNLRELRTDMNTGQTTELDGIRIAASERSIQVAMQDAERIFGPSLARGYVRWQTDKKDMASAPMHSIFEELRIARVRTAALARIPQAVERVVNRAVQLSIELRDEYRVEALSRGDARAAVYRSIFEQSDTPTRVPMLKPANWQVPTLIAMENVAGEISEAKPIDRYENHMLVWPIDKKFPAVLNAWEQHVLKVESERPRFLRWFRNSGSAEASLNIAYPLPEDSESDARWGRLRPDFIFFEEVNGQVRGSIVDPHSYHLADAKPKLLGLCRFVEAYPGEYHRVEAVAKVDKEFRVLNINDASVREAIRHADDAEEVFRNEAVSNAYL